MPVAKIINIHLLNTNSSRAGSGFLKPCAERVPWVGLGSAERAPFMTDHNICHESRKEKALGFAMPGQWSKAKALHDSEDPVQVTSDCISCL